LTLVKPWLRVCTLQALGTEVRTFTGGEISATTAVLVAAAVLLVCDLLGGMRAVAYTGALGGCYRTV
jgi:Na+(H+)/acetate symporter ActP